MSVHLSLPSWRHRNAITVVLVLTIGGSCADVVCGESLTRRVFPVQQAAGAEPQGNPFADEPPALPEENVASDLPALQPAAGKPASPAVANPKSPAVAPTGKPSANNPPNGQLNTLMKGRQSFQDHCLDCHDADKALSQTKDLNGWLKTINTMAKKDDANIPAESFNEIAAYLTLAAGSAANADAKGSKGGNATDGNSKDASNGQGKDKNSKDDEKNKANDQQARQGAGEFQSHCTTCHDADKSTSKVKSLADWKATVLRMAAKQGANIPASSVDPIAAYLASLGSKGESGDSKSDGKSNSAQPAGMTISGTLSPTWRDGNEHLQNGGFFPDVWVGINWDNGQHLSGRATACISCHTVEEGQGDRIEFVEAALRYDFSHWFADGGCCNQKAAVDAGRLVVPFGAFSSQSNPGVYRTVTRPLIYNMGQRVFAEDLGEPVIPMPYADEGVDLSYSLDIGPGLRASLDTYVVNGLRADETGISLDDSRDYVAFNTTPTCGARTTLATNRFRLGASIIGGQSSPTDGIPDIADKFYYKIYGFDAAYTIPNVFRLQFEYARRDSDRGAELPDPVRITDQVDGYYFETEYWFPFCKQLSFLARWDVQDRHSLVPPGESSLDVSTFGIQRFTYGLNYTTKHAGMVMINHEYWNLPGGLDHTDVLGLRWVYTF
jgi:cytochrome c2